MYGKLDFSKGELCLVSKSLKDLAKRIVNNAIEEEQGKNVNDIERYLRSWVETLDECSNGEVEHTMADVVIQASDNLVYTNSHYYNGRTPLNSDERNELCCEVESLLEQLIKTLELV
jgi:hypothetical protein